MMKRILLFTCTLCLGIWNVAAMDGTYPDSTVTLKGTVKDARTKKRLAHVNVYLPGQDVGTVTNADGFFSLKVNDDAASAGIRLSCLGYASMGVSSEELQRHSDETVILLTPTTQMLREVTIYGGDAESLVKESIQRIGSNYPLQPNLLDMFYRETVMKGNRFVGIAEGVMDAYKNGYSKRFIGKDRVRIKRGRRLLSQSHSDTLAIKMQGGPLLALGFDIVKNGDALFDPITLSYYDFRHEQVETIDDRLHYVVRFTPRVIVDYPLYSGLLYIDSESLCLSRAELTLDVSDREKANRVILQKKPMGLHFRTREASMVVAYRRHGERCCLDYIRSTIRFTCDWKRRLFSSAYSAVSEMVVVDINQRPPSTIPQSESYSPNRLFYDDAAQNWDADFWHPYNIIEPTESLEKAVIKLKRHR